MSTKHKDIAQKPTAQRRPLTLCAAGVLLAAVAVIFLLLVIHKPSVPVLKALGKTYTYGQVFDMNEDSYIDFLERTATQLTTRTISDQEIIVRFHVGKDLFGRHRNVVIGGLQVGDPESDLFRKYPKAELSHIKMPEHIIDHNCPPENYVVYYYEGVACTAAELEAILQELPAEEAESARSRSLVFFVRTHEDQIVDLSLGDYPAIIGVLEEYWKNPDKYT